MKRNIAANGYVFFGASLRLRTFDFIERKGYTMKKVLAMLLALVMLFSLCACDNNNKTTEASHSSQATTEGTQKPADSTPETTGTTQPPATPPAETQTTPSTTAPATCSHSYKDATCTDPKTCTKCGATEGSAPGHNWNAATCTAPKTCSVCSATEGSALEHNYQNGTCTGCGAVDVFTHTFEEGMGYAAYLSSDGKELHCYQMDTGNLFYKTYVTEKPEIGYYDFLEYNGTRYYSPAPSWAYDPIASYTFSGRTVQLMINFEAEEPELELELISENQYKVTKGTEHISVGVVLTYGTDICDGMGHLYERSCENDVTCLNCDHFLCAGFGHEYGEDDVCFRCFSAMRPSAS